MSANLREVHLVKSIHAVLGHDESLLQFFFHHKRLELRVSEEELLQEAERLRPSEWILIKVALDFWNGKGETTLNEVLRILDDDSFIQVVSGILKFREIDKEIFLEEPC